MDTQTFLSRHGVKGMKWGVRKDDSPSREKRGLSDKQKRAIKIAGITATAASVAIGAYFVSKHLGSKNVLSDAKKAVEFVDKLPDSPIILTRGKNINLGYLRKGGLDPDALDRFAMKVDLYSHNSSLNDIRTVTQQGHKMMTFKHPSGVKDFAGRPIPLATILPPNIASSIKTAEEFIEKTLDLVGDEFDEFYRYSASVDSISGKNYWKTRR